SAPHGHWSVRTLISSVRADGETACLSVDAATDAEIFQAYVQKILVPTLRPGDIVVMDNLGSHKRPAVEKAVVSAGARVEYLPAYSPDLNPIEKMWSKIKAHLRAAEARTSRTLHAAIRKAFDSVTPEDAGSWFASCGYTIT
ncbi:MAG: IS630 family transposase, partial [Kiritimatiellae bacterium]|nr:IS630 family transposase [Kiritimatiellia bacterium]